MLRRHHHRWIALLALFGLLFQQAAMATYWCPVEPSGTTLAALRAEMAASPCHHDEAVVEAAAADPVRCEQHCHPTVPSAEHTPSLTVPAALAPESWVSFAMPVRATIPARRSDSAIDPRAGAPPLQVRFCSFQI